MLPSKRLRQLTSMFGNNGGDKSEAASRNDADVEVRWGRDRVGGVEWI